MPAEVRSQLSSDWLAKVAAANKSDPWTHGWLVVLNETNTPIGQCGFKGAPSDDGMVEIAYGIDSDHQGRGFATEAAQALVNFALRDDRVEFVRAHTLPEVNASTSVLAKCGFQRVGKVVDPEDGPVWRWEKS